MRDTSISEYLGTNDKLDMLREVSSFFYAGAKPTVLTKNSFNRKHPIIYYQIVRLEKTLFVFDKQLIVIGACLPNKIKTYGYKGAM